MFEFLLNYFCTHQIVYTFIDIKISNLMFHFTIFVIIDCFVTIDCSIYVRYAITITTQDGTRTD